MGKPGRKRVTSIDILAQLLRGTMTCAQLAQALNTSPKGVQRLLDGLLRGDRICVDTRVTVGVGYCVMRIASASGVEQDISVAGPHVQPDLKSSLTGYCEGMRRHVELCMMARAR